MGEVESKKGGSWGFGGLAGGSGWQGCSRNEKNLAAAHCALVMRSMCRRGARLLISGGSRAFHARLVIGPEGAFIPGDSNCEGSAGWAVGASGKEGGSEASLAPFDSAGIKRCSSRGRRITNERRGEKQLGANPGVFSRVATGGSTSTGKGGGGLFVYKMDMIAVVVFNAGRFAISSCVKAQRFWLSDGFSHISSSQKVATVKFQRVN